MIGGGAIGDDVRIGINATILGGVKIRQGVIIGAGAVVAKDIPPYTVARGVHDKVMKALIFFLSI